MKKKISLFLYFLFLCLSFLIQLVPAYAQYNEQDNSIETYTNQFDNVPNDFGYLTINKDNFLDYFTLNGAATYDQNTGIITLTTDTTDLVGSATFNKKVLFSKNFSFDLEANIGNKSMDNGGADGIGLGFHDGLNNAIGSAGNAFGFGGLSGVFAFKLDTYYNGLPTPNALADPSQFKDKSFGAFIISNTQNEIQTVNDATLYGPLSIPQQIPNPVNNQFSPFTIQYDSSKSSFTVHYDTDYWQISDSYLNQEEKSLSFTASTGLYKNLQQLKIKTIQLVSPIPYIKKVDKNNPNLGLSRL